MARYRKRYVPWLMQIEPTTRCNANCIFCPREDVPIVPDFDLGFYKDIIDNTPFITQLHTQGFGEPLLYPHIVEMVKYASDRGKRIVFYTNASPLSEKMSRDLLEAGMGQIRFSVDECTKEGYEALRPPLSWERILKNIETFQRLRDEGGYKTTSVVRIVKTDTNKDRLDEIIAFWKERVDIVGTNAEVYVPTLADYVDKEDVYDGEPIICDDIVESLILKHDGNMLICCQDCYRMHPQANLHDIDELSVKGILGLYNSEKFNVTREALKSGKNIPINCYYCAEC